MGGAALACEQVRSLAFHDQAALIEQWLHVRGFLLKDPHDWQVWCSELPVSAAQPFEKIEMRASFLMRGAAAFDYLAIGRKSGKSKLSCTHQHRTVRFTRQPFLAASSSGAPARRRWPAW